MGGGSADGNCAAGFGVCCVIFTTSCGTSISTNTTYIRNPNYPSSYTPTSTGTCQFTINKASDDVCQPRLDFQTFSGFTATSNAGACTDSFAAAGKSGKNPPSICGTNTDYHMYVEFGATATDTITLTWGDITTAKTYNILARQIACTATWKAPTDCTQFFTGISGNVKSYNFAGAQLLQAQTYTNCIRTEAGYCAIQFKQSFTTSPDPFGVGTFATNAGSSACTGGFIMIPGLTPDGIQKIPIPPGTSAVQSAICGTVFGLEGGAIAQALVTRKQPFIVGVYTESGTAQAVGGTGVTGFNLDYTQLPC